MIKGIIFDLDGTLANSIDDIADSMNKVLEEQNLPQHSVQKIKEFIGHGIKGLVVKALPKESSEKVIEDSLDRMMTIYGKNIVVKTSLFEGIDILLSKLSEKNIKLGVFSNKADALTKEVGRVLLKKWNFVEIIGSGNGIARKPKPDGALAIAKKMELSSDEIMYVGDTDVDIACAKNAKMTGVGVLWGFRSLENLTKAGADIIIKEPLDLLKHI